MEKKYSTVHVRGVRIYRMSNVPGGTRYNFYLYIYLPNHIQPWWRYQRKYPHATNNNSDSTDERASLPTCNLYVKHHVTCKTCNLSLPPTNNCFPSLPRGLSLFEIDPEERNRIPLLHPYKICRRQPTTS